jgi:hypothetical protein
MRGSRALSDVARVTRVLGAGSEVALLTLGLLAGTGDVGAAAGEDEGRPTLQVVRRLALAEGASQSRTIADVRWAGRDSLYVAYLGAGVEEVELRPGLPAMRRVLPSARSLGMPVFCHLAASGDWLLAAHGGKYIAWTPVEAGDLGGEPNVRRKIGFFQDLDVRGDQVILLGSPDPDTYARSEGGVLWRADLSRGLDPWEVVLENEAVAKNFRVFDAKVLAEGSVRFLRNGDFVVAPNFLPGVLLFSSAGKLKKTWTPEELWGEGERTVWREGRVETVEIGDLRDFLAVERVIDEVLVLPEGPAIVVREPGGKPTRWRLGVLGPEIRWYDIPTRGISPVARLRGDADHRGRIALVPVVRELHSTVRVSQDELLVLALPE